MSVSLWFYKTNWESDSRTLFCFGYPSYTNEFRIGQNATDKFYFDIRTNSGTYKISTDYPTVNAWHHIVALRVGTQMQFYIDGDLKGSVSCDSQPFNFNTAGLGYSYLFIGFDVWNFFNGKIDDVRVYNRALTNTEIQYLKNH